MMSLFRQAGFSEGETHVGNIHQANEEVDANSQEERGLKRFLSWIWTNSGVETLVPGWSLWEKEQGCKSVV